MNSLRLQGKISKIFIDFATEWDTDSYWEEKDDA